MEQTPDTGTGTAKSYIYVVVSGSHCKVGIATNLKRRLKQLQNGSPHKLLLFWSLEVPSEAAKEIEVRAHGHLSAYRTEARNEWFAINPEIACAAISKASVRVTGRSGPVGPCGKDAFRDERRRPEVFGKDAYEMALTTRLKSAASPGG